MATSFDEEIQEATGNKEQRRREDLESFKQKQINQIDQKLSRDVTTKREITGSVQPYKTRLPRQTDRPSIEGTEDLDQDQEAVPESMIINSAVNISSPRTSNRDAAREDEERRREEFEAYQQQQAQQQYQEEQEARDQEEQQQQEQEDQQSGVKNALKQQATQQIKQQIKKRVIMVVLEFLASTSAVWGPILLVVLLVVTVIGFVVFMPVAALCGNSPTTQAALAAMPFNIGPAVQAIRGVACPTSSTESGGVTNPDYEDLDIVITSAYRPGAIVAGTNRLSAHGRGEAVDIALRNPSISGPSSDPRLTQLLEIARSIGFATPVGDTLDEYNRPTEGATGGHVHIEFNLQANGTTYCDGSTVVRGGPTDLVSIPASIPVQGASDPRLRPCMLEAVQEIFAQVGAINP